jgi:hypothetical protein
VDRRRFLGLAAGGVALLPPLAVPSSAAERWSSLTVDRRTNYAVAVAGDRLLIAGGWHEDPLRRPILSYDRVDMFDATADTWPEAALSVARSAASTASVGSLALIIGGVVPGDRGEIPQRTDAVDIYDSVSDSWIAARLSFKEAAPPTITVGEQKRSSLAAGSAAKTVSLLTWA